jgi:hypothetical protein
MTTAIRDQLQSIYDEQGVLTPALVVETARDENHPLHASFEWDDGIAGEKYRHKYSHLAEFMEIVRRDSAA